MWERIREREIECEQERGRLRGKERQDESVREDISCTDIYLKDMSWIVVVVVVEIVRLTDKEVKVQRFCKKRNKEKKKSGREERKTKEE